MGLSSSTLLDQYFVSKLDSHDCPKHFCSFLTDVEGNYEYFESYVEISAALAWDGKEKKKLKLKEHSKFVFGGDSQDKGTGDIRVVKLLLDLKDRYPDRVFFIIGNRDANKLRLTTELSDQTLQNYEVKNDESFPYWLPKDKVHPFQYDLLYMIWMSPGCHSCCLPQSEQA